MVNKKPIRARGKLKLSRYFQKFKAGDSVAVIEERSVASNFPKRLQGRTGIVEKKQGREYAVKIMDVNKEKTFIIAPIHLKKIKTIK